MTKAQQKQFAKELTQSVLKDVKEAISSGKIPSGFDGWDGVELREYLFEKFSRARALSLMKGKRKREYRNTVLVNNL